MLVICVCAYGAGTHVFMWCASVCVHVTCVYCTTTTMYMCTLYTYQKSKQFEKLLSLSVSNADCISLDAFRQCSWTWRLLCDLYFYWFFFFFFLEFITEIMYFFHVLSVQCPKHIRIPKIIAIPKLVRHVQFNFFLE